MKQELTHTTKIHPLIFITITHISISVNIEIYTHNTINK